MRTRAIIGSTLLFEKFIDLRIFTTKTVEQKYNTAPHSALPVTATAPDVENDRERTNI